MLAVQSGIFSLLIQIAREMDLDKKKAQDLLLNSDFDLDYIAQETGFYDCSHFIRQYKKWRGITPKQERMKIN